MWIKTTDDEAINLDNMVEIKAIYVREYNYSVVEAVAVTGQVYFLWQHDGAAVGMAKKWIDEHFVKARGDNDEA